MAILSIDIGGSKTAAALVEAPVHAEHSQFLEYALWESPPDSGEALRKIEATCHPWVKRASKVGVAFGGPFDFVSQTCVRSMHSSGWDGLALTQALQESLGLPVIADNDANVAALGEFQRNPNLNKDPLLYITLSTGLGAAIVVNGHVLRGAHSLAGELGHVGIGHGKTCSCGGDGCLERAVSGHWIGLDFGQPAQEYLADRQHHNAWIDALSRGLWPAVLLVDPALIVIGGGMATQGTRLLEPLREALKIKSNRMGREPPALELGDPTGRTVLQGAAILAEGMASGAR